MGLDEIRPGSRVFIDSTVFIYHFTGTSPECRDLLERCERAEIMGLTSAVVLAEVTHRLMMIEAVARGLVSPGNVVKKLRAKPDVVRNLDQHRGQVDQIPLMGIQVLPLTVRELAAAAEIRRQHGLLTNDSLVVAAARVARSRTIATADADFRRVPELRVFSPGDIWPLGVA